MTGRLFKTIKTRAEIKVEQAALVGVIGARMKEARELCGFTQLKAASLLDYRNSSKLNKIERASVPSVSAITIFKAAKHYDVSTDFLYGISSDWERDPVVSQQRQIGQWLFEHWERAKQVEVNAIRVLFNKLSVIEKAVSRAVNRGNENIEALNRFIELNPDFDNMRGGAKLLRLMQETAEEAVGISNELKRYHCLSKSSSNESLNMDIFHGKAE